MKWIKKIIKYLVLTLLLVAGAVYVFWMPSPQEAPYVLEKTWGGKGVKPGQFNEPTGIALQGDEVFVSDSRNTRIQVFDLDGHFKRLFGQKGDAPGQLNRPMNLALHGDELYVADYFNDRIQIYGLDGTFHRSVGESGAGNGQFNAPGGVAVTANGDIWVADFYNQRVQLLTPDGAFIRQIGQTRKVGMLDGKLNYPTSVATAPDDTLYIGDGYNDRVLAYDANGEMLEKWGGPFAMNIFGPFNGWFTTVTDVSVGPSGNIFVADFYNDRVQKFTPKGRFLNAFGIAPKRPTHTSIAAVEAADGSVFVADFANHQIQKWRPGK